eukprot:6717625-Pyramimonas_sp.AAC.1
MGFSTDESDDHGLLPQVKSEAAFDKGFAAGGTFARELTRMLMLSRSKAVSSSRRGRQAHTIHLGLFSPSP